MVLRSDGAEDRDFAFIGVQLAARRKAVHDASQANEGVARTAISEIERKQRGASLTQREYEFVLATGLSSTNGRTS